jgi:hypothetical protein
MSSSTLTEDYESNSMFGPFFEDESNGGAPADAPTAPQPDDTPTRTGRYSGTLTITGGRVMLNSGGLRAEVLVANTPPAADELSYERQRSSSLFAPFNGREVRLQGEQVNGYILKASPVAAEPRGGSNLGGSNFDEATESAFAKIARVIEDNRDELYRPGVIEVRPGYRFEDGVITDEPAIVVVVDRKLEQSSLEPADRLRPSIEGIRVDVAPATPLEQLRHRARETERAQGTDFGLLSRSVETEERFALPFAGSFREEREALSTEVTEALGDINYEPPPDVHLDEVTDAMSITCHVSPDAGWPTLKRELFDQVSDRLTIAMYDFTAPHILRGLRSAMGHATGDLKLILGPGASLGSGTKADDLPEATIVERLSKSLKGRFRQVWAVVHGAKRIFANSYHIKVAVRDGQTFWLSSGNWQSSNQPDLDPLGSDANYPGILKDYNREWHVIVNHTGLARMFEKFIEWDIQHGSCTEEAPEAGELEQEFFVPESVEAEEAGFVPRYFPPARFQFTSQKPLRVQPLLTPDNYARQILPLIRSAQKKLYFQNQSLSILENNDEMFDALVDALRDKCRDKNIDVRIILRGEYNARKMLEAMKARGFDTSRIRWQDGCHTKGIVVDSRIAVVSSHNWTNSGTLYNRDAGLIFYDSRIARYYEEIFLYDWENLARQKVQSEEVMPVLAEAGMPTPAGMMRLPLSALLEDS